MFFHLVNLLPLGGRGCQEELNRFSWSEEELLQYDSVDMKMWADQGVQKAAEERGLEKGRKEEKLAIATNLLSKGMSSQEVAEVTGLGLDQVKALDSKNGCSLKN